MNGMKLSQTKQQAKPAQTHEPTGGRLALQMDWAAAFTVVAHIE